MAETPTIHTRAWAAVQRLRTLEGRASRAEERARIARAALADEWSRLDDWPALREEVARQLVAADEQEPPRPTAFCGACGSQLSAGAVAGLCSDCTPRPRIRVRLCPCCRGLPLDGADGAVLCAPCYDAGCTDGDPKRGCPAGERRTHDLA